MKLTILIILSILSTSCTSQEKNVNTNKKSDSNKGEIEAKIGEYVTSIFEDSKGNLWFGTNGNGIARYDGEEYVNDDHCVKLVAPMPITYQNQPTAKVQNNQTQITWSVASQINNEKYIVEHSNPDSYREALNFSPIGVIEGDGTSNETKHYEYIHTTPSISINYYHIHPVG